MNNKKLADLFNLYMNKEANADQIHELFEYVNNPDNAEEVNKLLDKTLQNQITDTRLSDEQKTLILGRVFASETNMEPKKQFAFTSFLKIAASLILICGAVLYFSKQKSKPVYTAAVKTQQHDIKPGTNKAVLILADGSSIVLNNAVNGTLAKQGNTQIVKLANGKLVYKSNGWLKTQTLYNTMTTPRGGQYQLSLPDGTLVWLNAASSITYPTAFAGNNRSVSITGEAYFEVARNKNKPFYVKTGNQTVRVLGTHFNINSYEDEGDIKTTLLEGSVQVSYNSNEAKLNPVNRIIKPGEQAQLLDGKFKVANVNTDDIVAWKDGITSFNNADIKGIMRQLSRWYDVDVKYEGVIEERQFTGEISRTANLSEVFNILKMSKINFKIQNRSVVVSP